MIQENETRTQLTWTLTQRVSLVEQKLLIHPGELRLPPFFWVRVALYDDLIFNQLHYLGSVNYKQ